MKWTIPALAVFATLAALCWAFPPFHSSTSLIAAVEAGRGVALIQQGFESLSGPRLKVRVLDPAPPPIVVGLAYQKANNSMDGQLHRCCEAFLYSS